MADCIWFCISKEGMHVKTRPEVAVICVENKSNGDDLWRRVVDVPRFWNLCSHPGLCKLKSELNGCLRAHTSGTHALNLIVPTLLATVD